MTKAIPPPGQGIDLSDVSVHRVKPSHPLLRPGSPFTKITEAEFFEPIVLSVICLNALWIGYEVNTVGEATPFWHNYVENIFCVIFTAEIVMRFLSYKSPKDFFVDPLRRVWNLFDTLLVGLLILELWVLPFLPFGDENQPEMPGLSTLRLLRLLRIVRILRMMPELAMMVKSMIAALRSVSMTFVLAVGIMYIFSIVLTQWARSHEQVNLECKGVECVEDAFGSIPYSFLTLMQILCLDNTFSLIRKIVFYESALNGVLLMLFILLAAFTVLNMLVGVIVQIVSATNETEKDKMNQEKVRHVFNQLDRDGNGTVTKEEFDDKNAAGKLEQIGINPTFAENVFELIDDNHNDMIEMDEFLETMFKLMHPPQSQDVLLIHRKLEKLEKVVRARQASESGIRSKPGLPSRPPMGRQITPDPGPLPGSPSGITATESSRRRAVIERGLADLEFQVSEAVRRQEVSAAAPSGSPPISGRAPPQASRSMLALPQNSPPLPPQQTQLALSPQQCPLSSRGQGLELLKLDVVMRQLRQQLERCAAEGVPQQQQQYGYRGAPGGMNGPNMGHPSAPGGAPELQQWRLMCGEVAESLSRALILVGRVVGEQQGPSMSPGYSNPSLTQGMELEASFGAMPQADYGRALR